MHKSLKPILFKYLKTNGYKDWMQLYGKMKYNRSKINKCTGLDFFFFFKWLLQHHAVWTLSSEIVFYSYAMCFLVICCEAPLRIQIYSVVNDRMHCVVSGALTDALRWRNWHQQDQPWHPSVALFIIWIDLSDELLWVCMCACRSISRPIVYV